MPSALQQILQLLLERLLNKEPFFALLCKKQRRFDNPKAMQNLVQKKPPGIVPWRFFGYCIQELILPKIVFKKKQLIFDSFCLEQGIHSFGIVVYIAVVMDV